MRSLVAVVVASVAFGAHAGETVRVAVGRFPSAITISGVDLVALAADGTALDLDGDKLVIAPGASGLRVNKKHVDGELVRVTGSDTLTLHGHKYHRELEVRFRFYDKAPELLVVHPLDLETYVVGIVSSELPGGWPLEAYKAQAVAARTFALWQKYRRLDLPYHMESSVLDQVYGGVEREHALAQQAADETRGVVLSSKRHLAQAYFHASCGGHTESALEGWGTPLSYLPGSPCGFCNAGEHATWSARFTRADVDKAVASVLREPLTSIAIAARSKTGRVTSVNLVGKSKHALVTGADLRKLLGYNKLWSTLISKLELDSDALVVEGRGSGHGVGMCQWGA
ncbi:MAG TPA: SpoIID/LytB domain-containing protein, partial [Myxococcota bacterium]